ncbi:hypothetical protein K1719_002926 [Acacia pycnantha]|nr:hypothetical protein K1719_002926 [Acacia pycnantha]
MKRLDDSWTSSNEEIIGMAKAHFEEVYQVQNELPIPDILQELDDMSVPKISHEHFQSFLQPLNLEELKEAVFSLPQNSAPGPDGFHANFFQKYWNLIKEDLLQIDSKCETSSRPISQGGLGLKSISQVNDALLAKQSWRILSPKPGSLLTETLKPKYIDDN